MRIGIKYCGGCNPRYDRAAKVSAFKADFPGHNYVQADAQEHYDYVFIVCGCPSACANHKDIEAEIKKVILHREKDWDRLYELFQSLPQ